MARKRFKIIYIFCLILSMPVFMAWTNRRFISELISSAPSPDKPTVTVMTLLYSIKMHDINEMHFILRNELVNVNDNIRNGLNPLLLAVDSGQVKVVEALVDDYGAMVNYRTHNVTPLDVAINAVAAIEKYEKENHTKLCFYDEHGRAIYPIKYYQEIVIFLRDHGARTAEELDDPELYKLHQGVVHFQPGA